jgi:hypothetical protein
MVASAAGFRLASQQGRTLGYLIMMTVMVQDQMAQENQQPADVLGVHAHVEVLLDGLDAVEVETKLPEVLSGGVLWLPPTTTHPVTPFHLKRECPDFIGIGPGRR